jgi:hypothetical protein
VSLSLSSWIAFLSRPGVGLLLFLFGLLVRLHPGKPGALRLLLVSLVGVLHACNLPRQDRSKMKQRY